MPNLAATRAEPISIPYIKGPTFNCESWLPVYTALTCSSHWGFYDALKLGGQNGWRGSKVMLTIVSLFCWMTLSFFRKDMTNIRSSMLLRSSSASKYFKRSFFTIFASVCKSSARLRSKYKETADPSTVEGEVQLSKSRQYCSLAARNNIGFFSQCTSKKKEEGSMLKVSAECSLLWAAAIY